MKIKEKIKALIPESKFMRIKKVLNVLRIVKNIVCWTLVVVLSFAVITFLLNRFTGGTPSVFGYNLQRVASGSMIPALQIGDVILSKEVEDVSSLKKGDIITFDGTNQYGQKNVTHRIEVAPALKNGVILLQTKGDANEIADNPITSTEVKSVMITKVEWLKTLYNLFLSPWGLIVFIVLLLFIFFDELMNIVRIATGNISDEQEESISEIMERIQREDAEKARKEKQEKSQKIIDIMIDKQDESQDEGE